MRCQSSCCPYLQCAICVAIVGLRPSYRLTLSASWGFLERVFSKWRSISTKCQRRLFEQRISGFFRARPRDDIWRIFCMGESLIVRSMPLIRLSAIPFFFVFFVINLRSLKWIRAFAVYVQIWFGNGFPRSSSGELKSNHFEYHVFKLVHSFVRYIEIYYSHRCGREEFQFEFVWYV